MMLDTVLEMSLINDSLLGQRSQGGTHPVFYHLYLTSTKWSLPCFHVRPLRPSLSWGSPCKLKVCSLSYLPFFAIDKFHVVEESPHFMMYLEMLLYGMPTSFSYDRVVCVCAQWILGTCSGKRMKTFILLNILGRIIIRLSSVGN